MPAIDLLEAPYDPAVQASFDQIMPAGVAPLQLFRALAKSDRAWSRFRAGSLLDPGPLSLRQREIVIDRVCALTGCEYEWGIHVRLFSSAAGLSPDEIAATLRGAGQADCWSESEQALLVAVEALDAHSTLSAAEFQALRKHFAEDQIFEVFLLCGFYRTVAYVANGLALPNEPDMPTFSSPITRDHGRSGATSRPMPPR